MSDRRLDGWGDPPEDGDLADEARDQASDAELTDAAEVSCPYCGATVELFIDIGGGGVQDYVEDCEVCCRPWSVHVVVGSEGRPQVSLTTLDDE